MSTDLNCEKCDGTGVSVHPFMGDKCFCADEAKSKDFPAPVTAFEVFRYSGVRFLSFPSGNGIGVLDDAGNNYGSFFDRKSFKKFYDRDGAGLIVGKARVSFVCAS